MKKKIYYHNTDCGGVVYYGEYLKFFEEARTELFEAKGLSVKELAEKGLFFVVAHQDIDYKAPAFYGDTLSIDGRITDTSKVKMIFEYEVKNQDDRLICIGKTVMVCVDKDFKPTPISD